MASTKQNVHVIIHAASVASADADGESAALAPIRTRMIIAIASEHGIDLGDAAAAELLGGFMETLQGRQVLYSRQAMAGWLPGIDNAAMQSTAATITEAIGWTANGYFEQPETQ